MRVDDDPEVVDPEVVAPDELEPNDNEDHAPEPAGRLVEDHGPRGNMPPRERQRRRQQQVRRRQAVRFAPARGRPEQVRARVNRQQAVERADAAALAAGPEADAAVAAGRPARVCQFFARGQRCPYGPNCRFAHVHRGGDPPSSGDDSSDGSSSSSSSPSGSDSEDEDEFKPAPVHARPAFVRNGGAGPPYNLRANPTPDRLKWCAKFVPQADIIWRGGYHGHPLLATARVYAERACADHYAQMAIARGLEPDAQNHPNAWLVARGVGRRRRAGLRVATWLSQEPISDVDELRIQDEQYGPAPHSCAHPIGCACVQPAAYLLSNCYEMGPEQIRDLLDNCALNTVYWVGHIYDGVGRFCVADGVPEATYFVDCNGTAVHQVRDQAPYHDPANAWLRHGRWNGGQRAMNWKIIANNDGLLAIMFQRSAVQVPVRAMNLQGFLGSGPTFSEVDISDANATLGNAKYYAHGTNLLVWPQGAEPFTRPIIVPRELLRQAVLEVAAGVRDAPKRALVASLNRRWAARNPAPDFSDPLAVEWATSIAMVANVAESTNSIRATQFRHRAAIARANRHAIGQFTWWDYFPWLDAWEDWFSASARASFTAVFVVAAIVIAAGWRFRSAIGPGAEEVLALAVGVQSRIVIATVEVYLQQSFSPLVGHGILALLQKRFRYWVVPAHYAINALGFRFNVFHVLGDYFDALPALAQAGASATAAAASAYTSVPWADFAGRTADAFRRAADATAAALEAHVTAAEQGLKARNRAAERRLAENERHAAMMSQPADFIRVDAHEPSEHWPGHQRDYVYRGPSPVIGPQDRFGVRPVASRAPRAALRPAGIVNLLRRPVVPASVPENEDAAVAGRLLLPPFPLPAAARKRFRKAIHRVLYQASEQARREHWAHIDPLPARTKWRIWNKRFSKGTRQANDEARLQNWMGLDKLRLLKHQMFVKIEKLTKMVATGVAEFFPRAIESCSAHFNALVGPWFHGFGEWIKRPWNWTAPFFYLSGVQSEDISLWLSRFHDFIQVPRLVDVDRSRWDARVALPIIEAFADAARSILAMPRRVYRATKRVFRKHIGLTRHGFPYKTRGRVITGYPGTSCGNSSISCAVVDAEMFRVMTPNQRRDQTRYHRHRPGARLQWCAAGVGDDLVVMHLPTVPYDANRERDYAFDPKVNTPDTTLDLSVLSGRFYPTAIYEHLGRMLDTCHAGKVGRQATKFGWDITSLPRLPILRSNAIARVVDWSHVPLLGQLAAVTYALTEGIVRIMPRGLQHRVHANTMRQAVPLTYAMVARCYNTESCFIREMERDIGHCTQLPSFVTGTTAELWAQMADVDA